MIIVGMSGGVDSSVAAYLLKEQGYEVEGVSFILYESRLKKVFTGCCSTEAINDAKRTAEQIGVKHTVVDLRDEFMEKVIEPFIDTYSKGITPNPCILCNKYIKFPYLLKAADENGADFVATGHYARIDRSQETEESKVFLKRGIDDKKDQSYVLYVLRQEELNRLKLPLGEKRKDETRGIAKMLNLLAAKRPESQEICFIEDKSYFKFLEELTVPSEGPIIDIKTNSVIGSHKGVHLYTIGQRKRLGISAVRPFYVVKIDSSINAVYVGPKETAMTREFMVEDVNWLINHDTPTIMSKERKLRVTVKVRSTMKDKPADIVILDGNKVRVVYDDPQWAPALGQSAVFYDGDVVVGGGMIC